MKKYLIHIITILLLVSCTGEKPVQEINSTSIEHASLLQMECVEEGLTICRIFNPWKQDETVAQYLLVSSNINGFGEKEIKELNEKYGNSEIIRTPLEHITLTASCHGYLLDQIDASRNIAVFCDADYVTYNGIRSLLDNNTIANGGNSMAPNIETILSKQSDAIWISPFENASAGNIESLPIPVIYCADYMETSPLGRAEWMKFYGRLVDKAALADSLFNLVVNRYDSIKHVGLGVESQPDLSLSLMSELPYQATWYVPGGRSTMGILYKDAGYEYPWAEDNHSGSLALSSEIVLSKAQNADIWLFKYYADHEYTLEELKSQNKFYGQFKAAKEGNVFGCNTSLTDYYDVVPFRPDILLEEIKNLGEGKYFKNYSEDESIYIGTAKYYSIDAEPILWFGTHIAIRSKQHTFGQGTENKALEFIVLQSRFPATITALLTGSALGVTGLLLQSYFRNPLAGPSILGITSGANLAVAICTLGFGIIAGMSLTICAMVGAMAILLLLLTLGKIVRQPVTLLIIGILISYLTNAIITLLNYYSSADGVQSLLIWGMGNFNGLTMEELPYFAIIIIVGLILSILLIKPLNGWMIGELYAVNSGINLRTTRILTLLTTGLLAAVTTAYCGPIAFVGLSCPHLARIMTRTDNHRILLPTSALLGSLCTLLCLLISSMPQDGRLLPINALTPIFGVPVIIYILLRKN